MEMNLVQRKIQNVTMGPGPLYQSAFHVSPPLQLGLFYFSPWGEQRWKFRDPSPPLCLCSLTVRKQRLLGLLHVSFCKTETKKKKKKKKKKKSNHKIWIIFSLFNFKMKTVPKRAAWASV